MISLEVISGSDVDLNTCKEAFTRIVTQQIGNYQLNQVLLAKVNNFIVGFLLFKTQKKSNELIINHIEVTHEMKRKGIGTALMQSMIQKAQDLGKKSLFVEFAAPNLEILNLSAEDIEENFLQEDLAKEQQINGYNFFFDQFVAKNKMHVQEKRKLVSRQEWRELQFSI